MSSDTPRKVFDHGNGVVCFELDGEFYVYGLTRSGDPRVCHSEGMAHEMAASA